MCGISGYVGENFSEAERHFLKNEYILARGNEVSEYIRDEIYLLLSRLPTDGGEKINPFVEGEEGILLLNGIITNINDLVKNKVVNDTQGLLHGMLDQGIDFLGDCDGMFSGVYISNEDVYLFRDSSGNKPLYYTFDGSILKFSSTIHGLAGDTEIKSVPKGTVLYYDKTNNFIKKTSIDKKQNNSGVLEYLKDTIGCGVKKYLADFPNKRIGVSLSGGIDSSVVYKLILDSLDSSQFDRIIAYTIDGGTDSDISSQLIGELSDSMGSKLHHVKVDPYGDSEVKERCADIIKISCSYFLRNLCVSLLNESLAKRIKNDGVNVLYTGQGMDELSLGYEDYIRSLVPHINYSELIEVHEDLWDNLFEEGLLLRDERLFGNYQIETRPVFSFPGFVSLMDQLPYELKLSKKTIRDIGNSIGLPDYVTARKKVPIDKGVFNNSHSINKFTYEPFIKNAKSLYERYFSEHKFEQKDIVKELLSRYV